MLSGSLGFAKNALNNIIIFIISICLQGSSSSVHPSAQSVLTGVGG